MINASFATGLNYPEGIAFDKNGNLYVANNGNNTVSEFSPTGALINAAFVTGLSGPYGLAFDKNGNLYVSNETANTVSEYSSTSALLKASFANDVAGGNTEGPDPAGLAFDSQGNLTWLRSISAVLANSRPQAPWSRRFSPI